MTSEKLGGKELFSTKLEKDFYFLVRYQPFLCAPVKYALANFFKIKHKLLPYSIYA